MYFALSPAVLTSINQGRIGTLVVAAFIPILFTALYNHQQLTDLKWRKLYLITIVAAITAAFSPIFLLIWLGYHLYQLIDQYIASKNSNSTKWEDISKTLNQDEIKKRFALLITPFLFNIPNSLSFLFAPTSKLLEPGLSVPSGDFFSILLFNPGGPASPNLYLLAPFILYLILCLVVKQQRRNAVLALILLVFSATISSFFIAGNNSNAQRVWSGSLIVIAQVILTLSIFSIGERTIPQLRTINFGYKHILSAVTALITILSTVVMAGWGVTVGANSLVSTDNDQVIPAFISDLATTNERPKTLVVRKNQEQLKYFITRGSDLLLGEPDVSSKTPEIVHTSIVDLFNGVGVSSSQILGFYGIQYVFMKDPADPALVRTIDGIGGFTRSSATKDGVIWKVNNSHARVSFQNVKGQHFPINSNDISANGYVSSSGTIIIAESFDKSWRLLLNGVAVPLEQNEFGLPVFKIAQPGEVLISHDGTARRGWISLQLIVIISVIILALPAGRRRKEVPLEELL